MEKQKTELEAKKRLNKELESFLTVLASLVKDARENNEKLSNLVQPPTQE